MLLNERIREQRKKAGLSQETVDILLASDEEEKGSAAEQIYHLYKRDQEKKKVELSRKIRAHFLLTLAVLGGYVLLYFLSRTYCAVFCTNGEMINVLWWFIGRDYLTYLFGWLLSSNFYWISMAISAFPAIFGKKCYSFTTLAGFAIGLVTGEVFGHNPAGADYGHGHYGWAIWGFVFLFSIVMGIVLQKLAKPKFDLKSRKIQIWAAIFAVGIVAIIVGIRTSMPTSFS